SFSKCSTCPLGMESNKQELEKAGLELCKHRVRCRILRFTNWNDMLVTINTDASCFQHKYSGYAFYIICNDGKIQKAGMLKDEMNATEAEYACLCNALYTLLHSRFKGITKVVVNTDCLYVIKTVSGESKKPKYDHRIRRY